MCHFSPARLSFSPARTKIVPIVYMLPWQRIAELGVKASIEIDLNILSRDRGLHIILNVIIQPPEFEREGKVS